MIINFNQYFRTNPEFKKKILSAGFGSEEQFQDLFKMGFNQMKQLNLYAAKVMREFGDSIIACTDITGFGLLGHSDNLVAIQEKNVDFVIERIPTFGNIYKLDKLVRDFRLKEGLSAETSGGLFIVMKESVVQPFIDKLKAEHDIESWDIGYVTKGSKKTVLKEEAKFIEKW